MIKNIYYKICDLYVDIYMFFKKCFRKYCKHDYKFIKHEEYDPINGTCLNKRICRKCGKIDYKYSKMMKNYGIPNRRKPKWSRNI